MLFDALTFPFRHDVWRIFLGWALLLSLLEFLVLATSPYLGFAVTALCFLFFRELLMAMMRGDEGRGPVPHLPRFSNFRRNVMLPLVQGLMLSIICMLPVYLLIFARPLHEGWGALLIVVLGTLFPLFYFPMGMLALVHYRSGWDTLPNIVLPAIGRTGRHYLVIMGFLLFYQMLNWAVTRAVSTLPAAPAVASAFLTAFGLLAISRLMGLFYQRHKRALGWEPVGAVDIEGRAA